MELHLKIVMLCTLVIFIILLVFMYKGMKRYTESIKPIWQMLRDQQSYSRSFLDFVYLALHRSILIYPVQYYKEVTSATQRKNGDIRIRHINERHIVGAFVIKKHKHTSHVVHMAFFFNHETEPYFVNAITGIESRLFMEYPRTELQIPVHVEHENIISILINLGYLVQITTLHFDMLNLYKSKNMDCHVEETFSLSFQK